MTPGGSTETLSAARLKVRNTLPPLGRGGRGAVCLGGAGDREPGGNRSGNLKAQAIGTVWRRGLGARLCAWLEKAAAVGGS